MSCFGIGNISCYKDFEQVGEGTYGYVYKAKDKRTDEFVALKKLIFHRETAGFPLCAVREVKFLKSLQHKNIVKIKDIVSSKACENLEGPIKAESLRPQEKEDSNEQQSKKKDQNELGISKICGNLYIAFEFIEHDIGGLLDAKVKFPPRAVKSIMKQLLEVLDFLSEKRILHRDIKSSNILISSRYQIRLADFGLARSSQTSDGRELRVDMTNNVITMWYKPPELLLGATKYSHGIDVWSAGCVLAELELGRPLFPGKSELEQLDLICRVLGNASEDVWPGVTAMPLYDSLARNMPRYAAALRGGTKLLEQAVWLLERILVLDPSRRSSAKLALNNKYFMTQPLAPNDPMELEPMNVPHGASYHEYKTKLTRRRDEEMRKVANERGNSSVDDLTKLPQTGEESGDLRQPAAAAMKSAATLGQSTPQPPILRAPVSGIAYDHPSNKQSAPFPSDSSYGPPPPPPLYTGYDLQRQQYPPYPQYPAGPQALDRQQYGQHYPQHPPPRYDGHAYGGPNQPYHPPAPPQAHYSYPQLQQRHQDEPSVGSKRRFDRA